MSLVNYAKEELKRIDDGSEEQKWVNENILSIIEVFSEQGHSGLSASYVTSMVERLMRFKPIQPLTGEDDEWREPWGDDNQQQNKRCSSVFRTNFDNNTAHDIDGKIFSDDDGETFYSNADGRVPIKFPYRVPDKPEKVYLNQEES